MNEDLEALAGLYVLDRLDARERAAFEARLIREPELAALVRSIEATVAETVRALPQSKPQASTLAAIEARLDPVREAKTIPLRTDRRFNWSAFAGWGLAAVIALSLTTLAVQSLRSGGSGPSIVFVALDTNRNTFAEVPLSDQANTPDARFIQLASLAESYWDKPDKVPVRPEPAANESRGYALFDPGTLQGFIAIEQLPPITEGQRYHLWVVEPGTRRIIDAGILPIAGANRGLYSFRIDSEDRSKTERPHLFITVEDSGAPSSSNQPRGKVVLGDDRI
jgi:anti-sigma-K factor RskA